MLTRWIPGFGQEEQLGELTKDGGAGYKEFNWAPVNRTSGELLWVFPSGFLSHHGPLKDAIERLGGTVNRSLFADGFGGRQMDDFVFADDPTMRYTIDLVMDHGHFGGHVKDMTRMKFVRTDKAEKKPRRKDQEKEEANEPNSALSVEIGGNAIVVDSGSTSEMKSTSSPVEDPLLPGGQTTNFCTKCGSKIEGSASYCPHCGQKLRS